MTRVEVVVIGAGPGGLAVAAALKAHGRNPLVVDRADGQAAVDLLAGSDPLPSVVVVDAQMEPRDGWWVVSWLRDRPATADVPVVMVTAAMQDHERKRAGAIGVDAFVAKPFDPDELVAVVRRLAESPA